MNDFAPLPNLNDFNYNSSIGSGFFSPNSIDTNSLINEAAETQDSSVMQDSGNATITNALDEITHEINPASDTFSSTSTNSGSTSVTGFLNYIENNVGNFATRIGVVILGFVFIAVALNMFADKTVINNITKALK